MKTPDFDQALNALIEKFNTLRTQRHPATMADATKDKPTVLIVGAGLAGITAANKLAQAGLFVHLIEAKDRVGGRIFTFQADDEIFIELGAQFLHGIKDNPLFLAMGKYKVQVQPMSRISCGVFDHNGQEIPYDELVPYIRQYKNDLMSFAQQRFSDQQDRFQIQQLKEMTKQLEMTGKFEKKYVEDLVKHLSIQEFEQENLFSYKLGLQKKESESNFLVTNGFERFIHAMLKEAKDSHHLELHLNAEVTEIVHDATECTVTLKNGAQLKGDGIICTVPLGVLQKEKIAFNPALPKSKTTAIHHLRMASHNKVIMFFKNAFWPNLSHIIVPFDSGNQTWLDIVNLNYFLETESPILVVSLHQSPLFHNVADEKVIKHITEILQNIFKKSYQPPKQCWVSRWDDDPFSFGAYSYHPPGSSLEDNTEIAQPLGRLCFAGEHTDRAPANVQSAYSSGLESAEQVIMQINDLLNKVG